MSLNVFDILSDDANRRKMKWMKIRSKSLEQPKKQVHMKNGPVACMSKVKNIVDRGGYSKHKSEHIILHRMANEFERRLNTLARSENVRCLDEVEASLN
jgi:hypothetical protein